MLTVQKVEEGLRATREEALQPKLTPALGKESINPIAIAARRGEEGASLTHEERIGLARDYFLTGNLSAIARERGILYNDLLDLARQGWFQEEVKNLEREANALLKVKLTKMLGSTLDALESRLEVGDLKWTGREGLQRIPVSARDLAVIGTALFEKKRAIEESETGFGSSEARRLLNLAEALRARGVMGETREIIEAEEVRGENGTQT